LFFTLPAAVLFLLRAIQVQNQRFCGGRFILHFPPLVLKIRIFVLELQNFPAAVSRQKIATTKTQRTRRKRKKLITETQGQRYREKQEKVLSSEC
jgi:hypothetical protein